jgi:hypothetical protein
MRSAAVPVAMVSTCSRANRSLGANFFDLERFLWKAQQRSRPASQPSRLIMLDVGSEREDGF